MLEEVTWETAGRGRRELKATKHLSVICMTRLIFIITASLLSELWEITVQQRSLLHSPVCSRLNEAQKCYLYSEKCLRYGDNICSNYYPQIEEGLRHPGFLSHICWHSRFPSWEVLTMNVPMHVSKTHYISFNLNSNPNSRFVSKNHDFTSPW